EIRVAGTLVQDRMVRNAVLILYLNSTDRRGLLRYEQGGIIGLNKEHGEHQVGPRAGPAADHAAEVVQLIQAVGQLRDNGNIAGGYIYPVVAAGNIRSCRYVGHGDVYVLIGNESILV